MIWGAFSSLGKSTIAILNGRQNPLDYQQTLTNHLLPMVDELHHNDCTFMQDNASIHSSGSTKQFIRDCGLRLFDWPALSPDLNPIENVWGVMARGVYSGGRQYDSTAELERAIRENGRN
jgi:hypothetical protein